MAHIRRNYDTKPFWEGCDQHELRIAHCGDCQTWIHFPRGICPNCWSDNVHFETVDGRGRVVTFSRPRVADGAAPVITACVALDGLDGVRILGRLEGDGSADVEIGMDVVLQWGEHDGQSVPQFAPAGSVPA